MHPITIIILSKSDPTNTLDSLEELSPEQIIIGTFGPIKVTHKKIATIDVKDSDYNLALDKLQDLAQTDWILYLKDNETVLQFKEHIPNLLINAKEIYGFKILQGDIILKEPRLWNKKINKIYFKNPIFEKPAIEPTKIVDVMLYQYKENINVTKKLELWKKSMPLSIDALYYKAFEFLTDKNFIEFKRTIAHYLFHIKKTDIPSIMARYYLALIQGIVDGNIQEAIKNIVICLSENPLMAEFWCLLGDIFVKAEKFQDALEFYENAIILGGRRLDSDFWPMHISKYDTYPKEMIEKCNKILISTKQFGLNH